EDPALHRLPGQAGDALAQDLARSGEALSGRATGQAPLPSSARFRVRTTFAGTPTTTEPGGMSSTTTEFAPIRLSCPTVIGPTITAPHPISTRSSINGISWIG